MNESDERKTKIQVIVFAENPQGTPKSIFWKEQSKYLKAQRGGRYSIIFKRKGRCPLSEPGIFGQLENVHAWLCKCYRERGNKEQQCRPANICISIQYLTLTGVQESKLYEKSAGFKPTVNSVVD